MPTRPARSRKRAPRGHIVRPKARVLSDAALVSPERVIKPPPNQFTHEVQRAQPYFIESAEKRPTGEFPEGTQIVLMVHDGGPFCRVVDGQGLYVETAYEGLRRLKTSVNRVTRRR